MSIRIISATPGPNTRDKLLSLIFAHPEGITLKDLSEKLNRPVSMIQISLKSLISEKKVYVRLSKTGMQQIYYPRILSQKKYVLVRNPVFC